MKTLIATTALALSVAAPAFANDSLAASLGVDAGDYTSSELVRLQNAYADDDRSTIQFILSGAAAEAAPTAAGQAFAVAQAEQDNEHFVADFLRSGGSEVVSTQSVGASDAARAFAIRVAEEDNNRQLAAFLRNGGGLN